MLKTLLRLSPLMFLLLVTSQGITQELIPGKEIDLPFTEAGLPPTLHSLYSKQASPPHLVFRLPDNFDPAKTYPLLVYVPGGDGNVAGNLGNAETIAGPRDWVVASLPLFKKILDPSEPAGGLLVSIEDYPAITKAYQVMLGKLFSLLPNLDREKSAMVGFSNGALTLGVLLSNHDELILSHFKNFCLVDHGMFHLMDLHKKDARDCRYLILVGDQPDMGRELKIRQGMLLQDAFKLLGVNFSCQIMKDTGHEFQPRHMAIVGKWLRGEPIDEGGRLSSTPK
jgi:hypothetical protein